MLTFIRKERIRRLEERLEALEQAPKRSKTALKVLRTEWEDTLDRLNRYMGRLNARTTRAQKDEPEDGKGPVPPQEGLGTHAILEEHRRRRHRVLPG